MNYRITSHLVNNGHNGTKVSAGVFQVYCISYNCFGRRLHLSSNIKLQESSKRLPPLCSSYGFSRMGYSTPFHNGNSPTSPNAEPYCTAEFYLTECHAGSDGCNFKPDCIIYNSQRIMPHNINIYILFADIHAFIAEVQDQLE